MNKKKIKDKIKELPVDLTIGGLALLLGLAERSLVATSEILKGPSRGIKKSYRNISNLETFWDYYDELKEMKKNSARVILWKLQKKGLVSKKGDKYHLTSLGNKIIKIFKEKQDNDLWDGKWRIVMFDIPEQKKKSRNWLRHQLLIFDYKPIQKSVFIGKNPMKEDLYKEIIEQDLFSCIRLMTVGEIDDEKLLDW
ncbi:MAG: hypothetical protein US36_C0004G0016 [Candidatus Wolfebacteria bacterium GW2011_GWC1_37_10]|uniref:Transcriptional repressor PaaX-like central Cas2-like domain-containing protein n=1 Tax=Candidatus Wolfebacteria bacterium GW2011_GWC1_37_10 TaxID=1619010 RepID=A0A0G0GAP8_9BACT|nr:MAG: hypothetical protein US36_C0004G0016 [Candidatus Wolfebacteria bacterium GW2011_GWC1_37_10]